MINYQFNKAIYLVLGHIGQNYYMGEVCIYMDGVQRDEFQKKHGRFKRYMG